MIHDCSFVLCWLFMSPLFVLNSWTEHCSSDKSSTFCRFCSFPAFLHIWTLSSSDCMILRSIFSHWGQLMDSNTTIKKGSNIHWCSRRKHDALRAGGWKLFEFEDQGKIVLNLSSGKHASIFCCFRRAVINGKIYIFQQKKKVGNLHPVQKFSTASS